MTPSPARTTSTRQQGAGRTVWGVALSALALALLLGSPGAWSANKRPVAKPKPKMAVKTAPLAAVAATTPARSKPASEILAASLPAEWRALDPENTLYLELPTGRVVMELAADYAPEHAKNIKTLVREKYFDGLAFLRSQDNYVVQWGDPNDEEPTAKSLGTAKATLTPEFTVPTSPKLVFTKLPDGDVYAPEVGFSNSFAVGRNVTTKQTWLTHCYGALGVARGNDANSGNGSGLYVVIGHAPRHLDRNIAVVGRVVQGMDKLSSLPRGTGALGFYEKPEQRTAITSMVVAADVPESERTALEVLRSDSASFAALTEARRNRRDDWTLVPAGHIELCNAQIPVRPRALP